MAGNGHHNVSPVSPGFLFWPSRAAQQLPPDGVLLLTILDDFCISVLGEPITYARYEQIPGSDSPLSLPVYALPSGSALMLGQSFVLASGTSCRRSSYGYGGLPVTGDGPAGLSVPVHGVQWPAVLGWKSSVWLAASSPAVSGVSRSAGVGSPVVPFADVLGGPAWKGTSDGGCHQPAAGRGHNVVEPSNTVTVRHVATPHVIRNDGLGYRPDGVSSGRGRIFVTGAAGGSGGKVHVGHGPVAPSHMSG